MDFLLKVSMKRRAREGLSFTLVVIFLTIHATSAVAEFRLVPLGEILQVNKASIGGLDRDGSLLIVQGGLCYKTNLKPSVINIDDAINVLRCKGGKKLYLLDESYPYVAGDVIALGNNIAVIPFHTGGSGCCSAIVSFKYIPKTGEVSLVKSIRVNHPEIYLSKENVGDFDQDENIEILVGLNERDLQNLLSDSDYDQFYPDFSYFLEISRDGEITIDRNPKLYRKLIEKHEKALSKRFETGAYASWMFYNRLLKMNESGENFLKNIPQKQREKVLKTMGSIEIDRIIEEDIERNLRESSFNLKPAQPCR